MRDIKKYIWATDTLIVYGAHLVALECARWLGYIGAINKLLGFAVTDTDGNPEQLMGFSVRNLEFYKKQNKDALIILAMPKKYHAEAERHARSYGFGYFLKIGLEEMSEQKGTYLIAKQKELPALPFVLKKNINDSGWLDMMEKKRQDMDSFSEAIQVRHYKFPTLFYLKEEKWIEDVMCFDFCRDYEKVCGRYRNLHVFPSQKNVKKNEDGFKKILKIFMAFSSWDCKTTEINQYEQWIYPIQVGSALSGRKKGDLFDDSGDTISQYNGLFAEMTGAYWIWKNESLSEYKGLCHYRRHFIILEEEILALKNNHIDVILPTPRYIPGGIKEMFLAETPVKKKVFENMFCAVSELYVNEREELENYLNSCFYYPNNMVIAKKNIYDSYCSWIFPVLFCMREMDVERGYGHEDDRHIAYAAELLTSYYFVRNKDKYCIAVTDYKYI